MDVIIYHNPDCGTSRNTLALIWYCRIEPHVLDDLRTPPSPHAMILELIKRMGILGPPPGGVLPLILAQFASGCRRRQSQRLAVRTRG